MHTPYPLIFEPILKEKVWGGRRLERYGKKLPVGAMIGESWEIADLASTAASGGGGGAARSVIANGPLAGKTLHDAIELWGEDLLGSTKLTPEGNFPLLIKFLDARENLSVQVHPSPAYAAAHPEAHLKTECWYVMEAEPDSVIYKGIKPGVTSEQFAAHIKDGTVVDDLIAVAAVSGECHNLPSGTVHALGAGVLVAEVQTPSDTTFRVYDWVLEYGRPERELHIEQALECAEFGPAPGATVSGSFAPEPHMAKTDFFRINDISTAETTHMSYGGNVGAHILMVIEGKGSLFSLDESHDPVPVSRGSCFLLPAANKGWHIEGPLESEPMLLLDISATIQNRNE